MAGVDDDDMPQPEDETLSHRQRLQTSLAAGDTVEEVCWALENLTRFDTKLIRTLYISI